MTLPPVLTPTPQSLCSAMYPRKGCNMTPLEWIVAMACLTLVAMLIGHRVGRRDNIHAGPVPNPVHYGHSDVADHEYDDLPRT